VHQLRIGRFESCCHGALNRDMNDTKNACCSRCLEYLFRAFPTRSATEEPRGSRPTPSSRGQMRELKQTIRPLYRRGSSSPGNDLPATITPVKATPRRCPEYTRAQNEPLSRRPRVGCRSSSSTGVESDDVSHARAPREVAGGTPHRHRTRTYPLVARNTRMNTCHVTLDPSPWCQVRLPRSASWTTGAHKATPWTTCPGGVTRGARRPPEAHQVR